MAILDETDFEYPRIVTVSRPGETFDESGDYTETYDTVITDMTADIQLSLKVRNLVSEDATGTSDRTVWLMFCKPSEAIQEGDRVSDDTGRIFIVNAVGDWGSHVECVMQPR